MHYFLCDTTYNVMHNLGGGRRGQSLLGVRAGDYGKLFDRAKTVSYSATLELDVTSSCLLTQAAKTLIFYTC